MGDPTGLNVRRQVRHEMFLPAAIRVAKEHSTQVRLAPGVADEEGWVDASLVDFSLGGMGLIASAFFPMRCAVEVRVYSVDTLDQKVLLGVPGRIQRIVMTDGRPAYLLGISFQGDDPQRADALAQFNDILTSMNAANAGSLSGPGGNA